MTNEEFQRLVLEQLAGLNKRMNQIEAKIDTVDNRLSKVENNMATKADIERLDAKVDKLAIDGQEDIKAMLTIMNGKLDKQSEILKMLSSRSIEQEAEISILKRAK